MSTRSLIVWWKVLALTVISGLGYIGYLSFNWDRFMSWGEDSTPKEFTDKDVLQCSSGTHQEGGRCVSNPGAAPGAVITPGASGPVSAPVKK